MKTLIVALSSIVLLTSCYSFEYSVGKGAQKGIEVKEKNHYVVFGLAKIENADPTVMAGDSKDYTVEVKHTFVDGLISSITFGLYTPTTTIVTK